MVRFREVLPPQTWLIAPVNRGRHHARGRGKAEAGFQRIPRARVGDRAEEGAEMPSARCLSEQTASST